MERAASERESQVIAPNRKRKSRLPIRESDAVALPKFASSSRHHGPSSSRPLRAANSSIDMVSLEATPSSPLSTPRTILPDVKPRLVRGQSVLTPFEIQTYPSAELRGRRRDGTTSLVENRLSDFGNRPHDFFETDSSDGESTEDTGMANKLVEESQRIGEEIDNGTMFEGRASVNIQSNIHRPQSGDIIRINAQSSSKDEEDRDLTQDMDGRVSPRTQISDSQLETSHPPSQQQDTPKSGDTRSWQSDQSIYPYLQTDDNRRNTQTTINTIGNRSQRSLTAQGARARLDRLIAVHAITMKAVASTEIGDDEGLADGEFLERAIRAAQGDPSMPKPTDSQTASPLAVAEGNHLVFSPSTLGEDEEVRGRPIRKEKGRSVSATPAKRVSVVPPPIDTTRRRSSTSEIVKTPFPSTRKLPTSISRGPSGILRNPDRTTKVVAGSSNPLPMQSFKQDSILTLSVTRRHAPNGRRVGKLTIPGDPDLAQKTIAAARRRSTIAALKLQESNMEKKEEKELSKHEFDDAALFQRLRTEYYNHLLGNGRWMRFWRRRLSFRSLKRIAVVSLEEGPLGLAGDEERYQQASRSPRMLVRRGLSDTFSEAKLLQHFENLTLGRAQFAWVHWAHRVAQDVEEEYEFNEETGMVLAAGPGTRDAGAPGAAPVPGGLEFIEGWSVGRLVVAAATTTILGLAAALAWIFGGQVASPDSLPTQEQNDSIATAGSRVASGMLVGLFTAMASYAAAGLWAAASWLLM